MPQTYIFNEMSAGVVNNIKFNLVPPNSVDRALNMVFDEIYGEAVVRKGTTILGAQLHPVDNAITGIHYFSDSAGGANSRLIAVANSGSNNLIRYYDGAAWSNSDLTTDTAGLKTRFETFLDRIVRINGTDQVLTSANGINWSSGTVLDDANFPNGKFLRVYKDQMVVAVKSTKPDSLYVSSVPNAAGTAISWTSGNREIVINPEDGQNITGLGEVGGNLLVFKDRAMYRWNNRSTEADTIVEVGASSQESIVNCGTGLISFFNPKGVWLTSGEQPILISRRVQKWIDGMSASYYSNVASYGDGEHVFTSIGSSTVDGKAYSNVVLRYSTNTKEWTVFSYAHQFRVFALYIDSGAEKIVGGDTTNRVLQIESTSLTDNSTAIGFEVQSHQLDFGSRGIAKELSERIMAYGLNPTSALVQVKVYEQGREGDWITLGALNKPICNFLINQKIKGNYMIFRVAGVSSTTRFRFQGLEAPKISLLDYTD